MGISGDSQENDCLETWDLLPTPRAGNPGSRPNKKGGKILAEEISRLNGLLPTPEASNACHGHGGTWSTTRVNLFNVVEGKGKQRKSTSSLGVSPASPSLPQESERERKTTASSGLRCFGLFERSSPVGSLARMLLGSLKWHSDKCVLSWKAWATKSNVSLYQLAPSTRHIEGTGCGLLDTPTVAMAEGSCQGADGKAWSLNSQIALLPTPAARDWKGARRPETLEAVGRLPSNDLESTLKAEPFPTGAETGAKLRLSP